jgi:hypothetical protein
MVTPQPIRKRIDAGGYQHAYSEDESVALGWEVSGGRTWLIRQFRSPRARKPVSRKRQMPAFYGDGTGNATLFLPLKLFVQALHRTSSSLTRSLEKKR